MGALNILTTECQFSGEIALPPQKQQSIDAEDGFRQYASPVLKRQTSRWHSPAPAIGIQRHPNRR